MITIRPIKNTDNSSLARIIRQTLGKGNGHKIINEYFAFAKELAFTNIYIETMPELAHTVTVYERQGFQRIATPIGNSGHFSYLDAKNINW